VRLLRADIDDASGLGIKGLVPCDGLTVLIGANGSGKSRTLEYIESLLDPDTEFKGRQSRMAEEPHWAFGSIHLALHRLDEPDGDWPWLREVIERLDVTPTPDATHINRLTRGWHADDEQGLLEDGTFAWFETEAEYLETIEWTKEQDRSFGGFTYRLLEVLRASEPANQHSKLYAVLPTVLHADELQISFQNLKGGDVVLLGDPTAWGKDAVLTACISGDLGSGGDGLAEAILRNMREPGDEPRAILRLGMLPDDDLGSAALPSMPVVRVGDRFEDPAGLLDGALERRRPTGERWFRPTVGALAVAPWLQAELTSLQERANQLAPTFITERGSIRFTVAPQGASGTGPNTVVGLERPGLAEPIEWSELGAGTRRWVAVSVEAACASLPSNPSAGAWSPSPLYLIDEPELHLHPVAQRSILGWVESQVAAGAAAVLATHSHVFLDSRANSANLVGVVRVNNETVLLPFTEDPLVVRL